MMYLFCMPVTRQKGSGDFVYVRFIVVTIFLAAELAPAAAVDFYVGVKGGLGLSDFWGAQAADSAGFTGSGRAGFCGGAMAAAQFNDFTGCQIELLYESKGKNSAGLDMSKEWSSAYLDIPLTFKLCYPLRQARALVYAGPSLSLLLSSSFTVTNTDYVGDQASTVNTFGRTTPWDLGLCAGGGMEFDITTGEIVFDLRFTPGFIDTQRDKGLNGKQNDVKNVLVSFMVGYGYKL